MNIPKLRFPEFKEDWGNKNLGELTFKVGEKNKGGIKYPIYSINNKEGFLPQSDQFEGMDSNDRGYDITLYKIIERNTFAYNPARINVGSIGYSGELHNIIISSLYVCFKTKEQLNDLFLLVFLKTNGFNKSVLRSVEGGVRDYLFYENFATIKIHLPDIPEQTRIASFFTVLDKKIAELKQKKNLLEQYKKGVMQKLFSQEFRFKDENGKEFPEWEKKKLGELGEVITGSTPSTSNSEFYDGEFLFVSPFDISENRFVTNTKTTLTRLGFSKGRKIRKGSILFVCIGSTIGKIAQVSFDCITNQQINSIVPVENDDNFVYSLLQFHSDIIKSLSATQAVPIINKTTFSNYIVSIPIISEQKKIANLLSVIDEKINRTENQIQQTQQYKKGLLQKMFC